MKDYVDSRDAAVESRLEQKLDRLSTKGTIWGAVATGVAILLGALAFAGDRFDSGMSLASVVEGITEKQAEVDRAQNAKLDLLDDKLDILLERTAGDAPQGNAKDR